MDGLTFRVLAVQQPRRAVVFRYLPSDPGVVECIKCSAAYVDADATQNGGAEDAFIVNYTELLTEGPDKCDCGAVLEYE